MWKDGGRWGVCGVKLVMHVGMWRVATRWATVVETVVLTVITRQRSMRAGGVASGMLYTGVKVT